MAYLELPASSQYAPGVKCMVVYGYCPVFLKPLWINPIALGAVQKGYALWVKFLGPDPDKKVANCVNPPIARSPKPAAHYFRPLANTSC